MRPASPICNVRRYDSLSPEGRELVLSKAEGRVGVRGVIEMNHKARRTGLIIVCVAIAFWVAYAFKSVKKPESIPRAPASVQSAVRKHVEAGMCLPFANPKAVSNNRAGTGGVR